MVSFRPLFRSQTRALAALAVIAAPAAQALEAGAPAAPRVSSPSVLPAQAPVAPPAAASSPLGAPTTTPPAIPTAAPGPAGPVPAASQAAPAAPDAPKPLPIARVSQDPVPTLSPSTFVDTMRAAERYRTLAEAGGWAALPPGTTLKPGERGPLVASLREHLRLTDDLPTDTPAAALDLYDAPLAAAVKRFQNRHALPETGLVGARTLEALNVPAETRQRQLAASAARLLGSNFPFGERYVVVNIPAATAEAVERGAVAHRYVAIVGKPDRATPEVATRITNVNLNPTWTVPASLIRKDIIPHVRKDPAYLAKMRIRVLDAAGREIDPATIDWTTHRALDFTIRQDPGAINSLGQVRIDMPNRHAVYMHDTPTKRLFAGTARFHSSGCVRVAEIADLAAWLLEGTPNTAVGSAAGPSAGPSAGPVGVYDRAAIEAGIASGERRDVKLARPVPVIFAYLTGYAGADGRAHFRDDIYGLDAPRPRTIEEALSGALTTGTLTTGSVPAPAGPPTSTPARPGAPTPSRPAP